MASRPSTAPVPLPLDLVFHGGSGSTDDEIATAVKNGVIKMNIDTDTQYAFSRSIADTVLKNYDGFLKVDGEVGNKKVYDPRAWGKTAESAMAVRVVEATEQLGSKGHSLIERAPVRQVEAQLHEPVAAPLQVFHGGAERQVVRREVHDAPALGQLHVEADADRRRSVVGAAQFDEQRSGVGSGGVEDRLQQGAQGGALRTRASCRRAAPGR